MKEYSLLEKNGIVNASVAVSFFLVLNHNDFQLFLFVEISERDRTYFSNIFRKKRKLLIYLV